MDDGAYPSDEEKCFITFTPGVQVTKRFTSVNKLEPSTLKNICTQVLSLRARLGAYPLSVTPKWYSTRVVSQLIVKNICHSQTR